MSQIVEQRRSRSALASSSSSGGVILPFASRWRGSGFRGQLRDVLHRVSHKRDPGGFCVNEPGAACMFDGKAGKPSPRGSHLSEGPELEIMTQPGLFEFAPADAGEVAGDEREGDTASPADNRAAGRRRDRSYRADQERWPDKYSCAASMMGGRAASIRASSRAKRRATSQ